MREARCSAGQNGREEGRRSPAPPPARCGPGGHGRGVLASPVPSQLPPGPARTGAGTGAAPQHHHPSAASSACECTGVFVE